MGWFKLKIFAGIVLVLAVSIGCHSDERLIPAETILRLGFWPFFFFQPLVLGTALPRVEVFHHGNVSKAEFDAEKWEVDFLRWGMNIVMEEIRDYYYYFAHSEYYNYKHTANVTRFNLPCSDNSGKEFSFAVFSLPGTGPNSPAIVFFHGGGMVLGDEDMYDAYIVGHETGAVIISVGYRLAPENPFPAGLNDCYDALVWTIENAHLIGVNPAKVSVGGSSAGGLMAAAVSLRARNNNLQPKVNAQYLHIPVLRYPGGGTISWNEFFHIQGLNAQAMSWFWAAYSADAIQCMKDEECSPLMTRNFSNLPPAVILTATCDILRDDGLLYARYLKKAGVNVTHGSLPNTHFGASTFVTPEMKKGLHHLKELIT